MKSYEEMADDVFQRINAYEVSQKKKRKVIARAAVSFGWVCLVVFGAFGIGMLGKESSDPPATLDDSIIIGEQDYFDDANKGTGQATESEGPDKHIVINRIDRVSADSAMDICLLGEDFVAMDQTALKEYYGVDVIPTVPEDLKKREELPLGIYRRDGGTGEVYWDVNSFSYANEDFSRYVTIAFDKGSSPFTCCVVWDPEMQHSNINNVEVTIGSTPEAYYCAEFMLGDTGFRITSEGLTEAEFVTVVVSLLS